MTLPPSLLVREGFCPPPSGILATPLERVLVKLDERRGVRPGHQRAPRVVTLRHDTSVAAALATLAKHSILSAPVVIQPVPHDASLDAGECKKAEAVALVWFGLVWFAGCPSN
jgi:hypothetical protein